MGRFCRECGNQLSENAKFCPQCGTSIMQSVIEMPQNASDFSAESDKLQLYQELEETREKMLSPGRNLGKASLIIDIIALVCVIVGFEGGDFILFDFPGVILGIVGLILGMISRAKLGGTLARVGIALGAIAIVVPVIKWYIFFIIFLAVLWIASKSR